jgi:hypothetical protein
MITPLFEIGDSSTSWVSWQNKDMHLVTSWHTDMSIEQRDTRNAVSSVFDANDRSGISLSRLDSS